MPRRRPRPQAPNTPPTLITTAMRMFAIFFRIPLRAATRDDAGDVAIRRDQTCIPVWIDNGHAVVDRLKAPEAKQQK